MKNIHFHFLVYEIGILFSLLTVGVCKSLSGVRMKVLGSEQGRAITKTFQTSAELCLTVVSKGRDRAAADSQHDSYHHVVQHEAV